MDEEHGSLTVSVLAGSEYALWDEFVSQSPQGTIFHTTTWANILARHFRHLYRIHMIIQNNQPLAGCLTFEHKRFGQSLITPLPLYPYSGPLFYLPQDEKPQKTVANYLRLSAIFISYLNNKYPFWILDGSYDWTDVRAFRWAGCLTEPTYTYLVDLDERQKLVERYSQSLRKKIRQAKEKSFLISTSTDPSEFIRLYIESYKRHGMTPLLSKDILYKLLPDLLGLPQVKMYNLQLKDQTVASRIIVTDRNIIYDLLTGGTNESGVASAYLLSHIIESFCAQNLQFNFLGADHPQIEQFKRSFGGYLVHGFRITRPVRFPISLLLKIRTSYLSRKRRL
jgi:Acetyltransferase (GNAT) domain